MTNPPYNEPSLDPRLQRLLGGKELVRLRSRMRSYFARVDDGTTAGTLYLRNLSTLELETAVAITGRVSKATDSARIDVATVDALLREAGIASSLREALEQLDGPIVSKRSASLFSLAAWEAISGTESHHDTLRKWLSTAAALPLLKRLSARQLDTAAQLLEHADAVLSVLPANGIPRSQLAAETLGNAHALDKGSPVATIVLAAWRHCENVVIPDNEPTTAEPEQPGDAQPDERTRDIWARAGVLVNELARPALFLDLPVANDCEWQPILGEPGYLSLRQLIRKPPAWAVHKKTVFICENPNLLAIAANRLGRACAPLVCTDGMPSAAQQALLNQLREAGARLMYHGDFDWAGLRIGNFVVQTWDASPWRFSRADYHAAVACSPRVKHPLSGSAENALWDQTLSIAMQHADVAIAEEAVATALIADLGNVGEETSSSPTAPS